MHFSAATILALPLLAAAQSDSPLEQAKKQALSWGSYLQNFVPKIQNPNGKSAPAVAAKAGGKAVHILTLNDWEDQFQSTVKPTATADGPAEHWWVYVTGGNKTCFGHCEPVNKAFNETAALWSLDPTAPHLGYINCDLQPVLCNSWGAGAPSLWIFELRPRPALNNVWVTGFNISTTTVSTLTDLRSTESYKKKEPYEGYFHPLDGMLAVLHIAKPIGYFFWAFTIVPNWLFMILVSFASRSIM